ncbi:MAG TPA: DUF3147 family protein [Alphaproteobacteria bacterium]|nr:hypothetical protein [Rhodospirillaceae bacterium]HRJ12028.1 DUF3147 family protein [Alphaproteobacteria bacterium]
MDLVVKVILTALIVAAVSELSQRFTFFSALLISLPLTSILAFCWIYYETKDTQKIIEMSYSVFWLVIPSLVFFLLLPMLLKMGVKFIPAMLASSLALAIIYGAGTLVYRWFLNKAL